MMRSIFFLILLLGSLTVYAQKDAMSGDANSGPAESGRNRFTSLLAGLALAEDQPGVHIELMRGFKPGSFGFGIFTSFIRVPAPDYSAWTILGLQLRAGPKTGNTKPYFIFDYGMFNMVIIDDDLNMRTANLDLGGGVEIPTGGGSSFLVDLKWKRFMDYKAERDPYTIWTNNVGLKF